jgi:hypothetical protein
MLGQCDAIFTFMYLHHTHRFAGRSLNPFNGGLFNTVSHLPGQGLNFKIPCARPFYSGYRKKNEMCGISCRKNTKFLHAIAEVCLYLMHKNGTVTCIWSLTPQLEILRSESRHLYSLRVHYILLNHLNLFFPP